ncbi:hypothetical protein BG004_007377, partial [Podila humilis]
MRNSQGNTLRIHLAKSRDFVGIRSTRCQRKYNQDRYKVLVLDPPTLSPELAKAAAGAAAATSSPFASATDNSNNSSSSAQVKSTEGTQMDADEKTLFYFAIFDGHGGSHTADYLTANLDHYIEQAKPEMVPGVIKELRKIGGYFRTFRPEILAPFLPTGSNGNTSFENGGRHNAGGGDAKSARVQIKGKGGKVRPMIFIPHPNATEEEQEKDLEELRKKAGEGSGERSGLEKKKTTPQPIEATAKAEAGEKDEDNNNEKLKSIKKDNNIEHKAKDVQVNHGDKDKGKGKDEDEDEYDEDDDPFVQARRRHLNRTSPLPGGTTAYFGTDRSEYQNLFLREEDRLLRNQPGTELPPLPHKLQLQQQQQQEMSLKQRMFLSFLQCDTELIRDKYEDGSTASVVVVQSKGAFWETKDDLELVIAHVGDTRVLLCESPRGECVQLTTDHHPDAVVEADRIRKMAAYVSADSFGENMFMGQLANTRALGDVAVKQFGVSAEPELVRRTIKATEAAFLVLISDGISSVMSNQEVVDC